MTPDLERLKSIAQAATPGPWGWFGSTRTYMYLATKHSGRRFVMTFARKGLHGAQPEFQIDSVMVPASDLAIYEVSPEATSAKDPSVYRHDIIGFRAPDATFIAALNPAVVLDLIARIEELERGALTASGMEPGRDKAVSP
jgi:hypothetical protein